MKQKKSEKDHSSKDDGRIEGAIDSLMAWRIAGIILAIALLISIFTGGFGLVPTGSCVIMNDFSEYANDSSNGKITMEDIIVMANEELQENAFNSE